MDPTIKIERNKKRTIELPESEWKRCKKFIHKIIRMRKKRSEEKTSKNMRHVIRNTPYINQVNVQCSSINRDQIYLVIIISLGTRFFLCENRKNSSFHLRQNNSQANTSFYCIEIEHESMNDEIRANEKCNVQLPVGIHPVNRNMYLHVFYFMHWFSHSNFIKLETIVRSTTFIVSLLLLFQGRDVFLFAWNLMK